MNILITGASRGIGFYTARILSQNSKNKIIIIARNAEKLQELKNSAECINPNAQVFPISCDLSETNNLPKLITQISQIVDCLDIVINNAGLAIRKPFAETTTQEVQNLFATNFFSVAKLIELLIPLLSKSENAHVLNISSMGGFQGSKKFAGLAYYSASKAAIACLTECLAEEYSDKKISFNCLAFGAVNTEMLAAVFPDYKAPINADKMAEFVADFAQNGHRFFNGKVLPVSLSTP